MKPVYTLLGLMVASAGMAQTPPNKGIEAKQNRPSIEAAFKNRDADHDNFLSKTEISGSHLADAFDKLDTNQDGKLSLAEYQAGRDAMQGRRQGQKMETRFKERDTNGDGFVSKTEISGSRMANRFDAMDTNKDGKLSLDEMKASMHNGKAKKTT